MQTPSSRNKAATFANTLFLLVMSTFLALCLGAASPARAQLPEPTFGPLPCAGQSASFPFTMICTMTIEIFNDDPNHFIFPVLEMGQGGKDQWMQAWFSILNTQLPNNPFPRNNTYRIYINPANGIAPNTGVSLTLPLFTSLVLPIPNPMNQTFSNPGAGLGKPDTFIEWWSGGNIQLYTSPGTTSATQPPSLTNQMKSSSQTPLVVPWNPSAPPLPTSAGPPTCAPVKSKALNSPPPAATCEPLTIYVDTSGIGKQGGSQLLEYTLGAVNANIAPAHVTSWINYWLDTRNVDFDISYVDVAWMPGVMGTFSNDQVGYTGTPQTIDDFTLGACPPPGPPCTRNGGLTAFKNTMAGWPQYYDQLIYINKLPDNSCANPVPGFPCVLYLKFPSPIGTFAALAGKLPPTDLAVLSGGMPVLISETEWNLGPPDSLAKWPPIQTLYNNWIKWAGAFNDTGNGQCAKTYHPGMAIDDWCTAMVAQKTILLENYKKYVQLFAANKCTGTTVPLSDRLMMGHLYGFTPWVETGSTGTGCDPLFNLLQDTPGYCVNVQNTDPIPPCPTVANPLGGDKDKRDYGNYNKVKTAFDKLNYGPLADPPLPNPGYTFNPWVELIHADPSKAGNPTYGLSMPCSYAYSVDDAQGNIQAEGLGFILDIASTVNLENKGQCAPPINIALGYDPNVTPKFYKYAVCKITDKVANDRVKPVIPGFASFIISAQDPATCPIFVWDNVISGKGTPNQKLDTNPSGPPLGQMYTFRIKGSTTLFPLFTPPYTVDTAPTWAKANHSIIGCKGNSPYSSQVWCCNSKASSGVFVFSQPVTGAAHQSKSYIAQTIAAMKCTDQASCLHAIGASEPCNTDF